MKNSHQVSQGQIPTANQVLGLVNPDEEQMRQTMGKLQRPKISSKMPAPFNLKNISAIRRGQKNFQAFKQEQEQRMQNDNFFLEKLDDAVNAEEYKQMQNLLQPIQYDRAHTKIDSYQTNQTNAQQIRSKKAHLVDRPLNDRLTALDPLPGLDGISQLLQNTSQKQIMNLSSAFSNYDNYPLKNLPPPSGFVNHHLKSMGGGQMHVRTAIHKHPDLRLDQMITLGVFKSTSGTIKKMLHAPSLKMYAVKEVPISNVQIRQMLIDWIANWQHNCCQTASQSHTISSAAESFINIHSTAWNTPEGCVSVIQDYAANGSLFNLQQSIGAIPESILKHLAKQLLHALEFMHDQGMTHSNICASQIVFDRKGRVKLSAGFHHILKYKQEVQSTLNQHLSLVQLLSESLENYKNRQSLIKQKFSHLSANPIDGGTPASLMQQSYANNFSQEVSVKELKKQDLFDLGVLLMLASTGGLEILNEEYLQKIPNLQNQCCLIHAVKNFSLKSEKQDRQALTLLKIFNRLSENFQDFICSVMQQRFSKSEMKRLQVQKVLTASDLRQHSWLTNDTETDEKNNKLQQKKSEISNIDKDSNIHVILSLKELLNVSSDWNDVKGKATAHLTNVGSSQASTSAGGSHSSNLPSDFQNGQIEKVIDALTLALPSRMNGISGGNISQGQQFQDSDIKELSYDLGVDPKILKYHLQKSFKNQQNTSKQVF